MDIKIDRRLFYGDVVHLSSINMEKDLQSVAEYSLNPDFVHWLRPEPFRPMAVFELKKFYEEQINNTPINKGCINFIIRLLEDDSLAGYARINHLEWNHTGGNLEVAFGTPDLLRLCLYDTFFLLISYGFNELGLSRLTAFARDYEAELIDGYANVGFKLEVRQRKAVYRSGQYHDWLWYGIQADEWFSARKAAS